MDETIDQVQDSTDTIATDNQQASEEQSETTEENAEVSNLYELPDGRKLAGDALREEYLKLNSEFTKRSQRLAEIERQNQEAEARSKRAAEEAVSQNKLLENVDPTVKDAIISIVSPVIQEALGQRDKAEEEKRVREESMKELDALEKKYPKFNKIEILKAMQEPANRIYDPEVLYQRLHWDEYLDEQIKAAMKGKSGGVSTESTSTEAPKAPGETTTPKSWSEASKRAISRL